MEDAGASALELNIYRIAAGAGVTGGQAEADCVALVGAVRRQVKIPLAVKLHPHFSAFGSMARYLDQAGADGLVLFNRLYQPDIDLVRLGWRNDLALSSAHETRLGLLWLSELSGRLSHASLAASTGVETADEVVKYLLAGADAVMTTSALLRHGPATVRTLVDGLEAWLTARQFPSVTAIRGLMRRPQAGAEARERDDYIQTLMNFRRAKQAGALAL
jgi:dihydroorotate dehydrogenase (fumarate)